jgi:protochlorophyllide reductase
VITGTSSGLGKATTKWLLDTGNWHIICACRDVDKMNVVAEVEGFDPKSFTIMKLDLASFQSVRDFAAELKEFKADKPLDRLVCNAAVYQPSLPEAKFTEDGHEQQLQINHLSHFLLSSLLVGTFSPVVSDLCDIAIIRSRFLISPSYETVTRDEGSREPSLNHGGLRHW